MSTTSKRLNFADTIEGQATKDALCLMAADNAYNTLSSYSANGILYPDHQISFVDKHMNYLVAHPSTDPQLYMSNLRLMTRIR